MGIVLNKKTISIIAASAALLAIIFLIVVGSLIAAGVCKYRGKHISKDEKNAKRERAAELLLAKMEPKEEEEVSDDDKKIPKSQKVAEALIHAYPNNYKGQKLDRYEYPNVLTGVKFSRTFMDRALINNDRELTIQTYCPANILDKELLKSYRSYYSRNNDPDSKESESESESDLRNYTGKAVETLQVYFDPSSKMLMLLADQDESKKEQKVGANAYLHGFKRDNDVGSDGFYLVGNMFNGHSPGEDFAITIDDLDRAVNQGEIFALPASNVDDFFAKDEAKDGKEECTDLYYIRHDFAIMRRLNCHNSQHDKSVKHGSHALFTGIYLDSDAVINKDNNLFKDGHENAFTHDEMSKIIKEHKISINYRDNSSHPPVFTENIKKQRALVGQGNYDRRFSTQALKKGIYFLEVSRNKDDTENEFHIGYSRDSGEILKEASKVVSDLLGGKSKKLSDAKEELIEKRENISFCRDEGYVVKDPLRVYSYMQVSLEKALKDGYLTHAIPKQEKPAEQKKPAEQEKQSSGAGEASGARET